jgi:allantoin racemase
MTHRIMIINPNTTTAMTDTVVTAARPVTSSEIVGATPVRGVDSIESHVDEAWGTLGVMEQVRIGENTGVDGYVVACFGDTGVPAARELATGPVVGMTEAALMTAVTLAHRFTIVTMPRRTMEQSDRVVRELGLGHRCVVRAVDVPVAEVAHGSQHLFEEFLTQGRRAIDEDASEAMVLGCAGLSDLTGPLREALGIPVIDGVLAAVTMVDGLLAQGLTTSRAGTYAAPERLGPVNP